MNSLPRKGFTSSWVRLLDHGTRPPLSAPLPLQLYSPNSTLLQKQRKKNSSLFAVLLRQNNFSFSSVTFACQCRPSHSSPQEWWHQQCNSLNKQFSSSFPKLSPGELFLFLRCHSSQRRNQYHHSLHFYGELQWRQISLRLSGYHSPVVLLFTQNNRSTLCTYFLIYKKGLNKDELLPGKATWRCRRWNRHFLGCGIGKSSENQLHH